MWLRTAFAFLFFVAIAPGQTAPSAAVAGQQTSRALPSVNPFSTEADIQAGAALFQVHCSYCHGVRGEGGRGADLTAGEYRIGGSDPELYTTIRFGLPGSEMPAVRVSDDDVWKLVGFVKRLGSRGLAEKAPGDPAAGRAIYEKNGCASCHRIGREGGDLGPVLTEVGRRRGIAFLEESVLRPEAFVPNNYRAVQVILKAGQTVSGVRLNEDDLSIQLRDTSGNLRSFLKEGIREIRRDKPSLMPSYESRLSRAELTDLIAFLNSLKGAE